MSSSPAQQRGSNSSDNEKSQGTAPVSIPEKTRFSLFSKRKSKDLEKDTADDSSDDSHSNDETVEFGDKSIPEKKVTPVSIPELFRFATRFELFINFIGLICAAAAGAAQPMMSLLFGNLTTSFVSFGKIVASIASNPNPSAQDQQQLAQAAADFKHSAAKDALFLVVIGLGMFIATWIYMYVWGYTGELNARRVRENYLQAILRQDIAYFDKVGAGEVATRIQTDTHLVQQGVSEKVALTVMFIASFFTGFILAYVRSWRLALALSSILPCIGLTGAFMNKAVSRYMQMSLDAVAEGGTLAEEVISTIRTAQAFGTQSKLAKLYDVPINKSKTVDSKAAVWHGLGLGTFFFIIYSAYALAFYFGTTLILDGHADAGVVVNVFLSILIGSFSLALLAPEMQAITHGRAAAAKLFAAIDRVPTIDSLSDAGLKPQSITGAITFENVKFNYPSRPNIPILKGLSLNFPAGKTAALVGASGSGKSTIVSLVERFYDPLSGVVRIDGINVKDLNVKWLRSQIGLVSQEPTLFACSIWENVAHGLIGSEHEHASVEEKDKLIKEACSKANADGFISNLPEGYNTLVGERGFLISGGQKQRVAIARAIVSDPHILLLDEATSALDTQSEGVVQNALDKAAAGRTTITIAHRLSTIKDADQIYVMGDGMVLEQGTHNELLSDPNGPYAKLVAAQKLREKQEKERVLDGEDVDEVTAAAMAGEASAKEIEEAARKEIPLGRRDTGHSLASAILEKRRQEGGDHKFDEHEHSFWNLFFRMGALNRDGWKLYGIGAVAAGVTGLVYPAFGIVYGKAIDGFQSQGHALRIAGNRNALWFFLISLVSTCSISIQNYMFASAAASLTSKLRSLSFRAILRQDIEFFDQDKNTTGALTSGLSDNPQKINGLAGITLGTIVQSITTLVGGMIIGLIFGAKLAAVGIACIPFVVSAGYIRLRVVVLKDQQNKKAHDESAQMACEATAAIRTVASLTREEDCLRLYSDSLDVPFKRALKATIWSTAFYALSQSMMFYAIALTFWYGSRLVAAREFTTFQFFVCLMSVTFGAIQAGNVFSFVPDISSARGAAQNIVNLLDSTPLIDAESTEGKTPTTAQGHITVQDVHFRYPTRPGVRVLRDFNLEVQPGTYIALVGASGSGKSTIIQLIERFYDPIAGKIMIDGQDISELNVQEYRKDIALVSQEPTLYAGTVRFNILLGATKPESEITQTEIEAACRDANILDFINSLPDKFDTEVGGKGAQLSGGQKQRIAIARALLRNPKVLLLDEATSALDSQSEKVVQEALDQAAKGRTTIAIAHRLSTIQNADCIYFIKDGRVHESGTHDQLIDQRGAYYEYTQLQQLSKQG
ncbi:P-loop containing nucleoside triphosphate hydrolase protein [Sistotremastrum suecicum HHB10207 ss-3]|uniref:p-loop containing nucleoside triphosphate hydrolase protein n=1 Tax=Sistotremastrum suecicum HHB10207 ss-3 TaxID=1314776 RepID=A0A166EUD3_9AGAM|nr:P-loop containing nucleoside triphosphate hydrolase protein [Sistotremastrum suecicum HHB10207 ss-3]